MQVKERIEMAPQPLIQRNRLWIVLILGTLAAIGPIVIDLYLPALPQMSTDLQTSTSTIQLSLTACLLGLAIGQVIIGPISDIFGRRIPLNVSLIIFVVASFLCAFSPNVFVLVIVRFIQGLAGAGGIVISRAIARDLYSGPELTKFFSLLMLVNGCAPVLSPVLGGQLMKMTDWKGIFIAIGIFTMLMLVSAFFGLKETLPSEQRATGGLKETFLVLSKLFKHRVFMGYVLTQGLTGAGMFAYISASPFVLQDIYGLTAQQFSYCFAVNGIGIIIATQTTGRLIGRFREATLLRFGLALSLTASSLLFLAILLQASLAFILIPLFFVVSCMGIMSTTCTSLAMNTQGKAAGSASALIGLTMFILGAAVAPLVGIAGNDTAVPMAIVILTCSTGANFCYWKLANRKVKLTSIE
ncbi:MAG TPA: multidrug effflux MFS transporter [Chondromyces sp.]|nr:multidrug effflux MFS transporter [Chondromyces sp.]